MLASTCRLWAYSRVCRMSARCSSGDFFSWCRQCLSEPLQSRLMHCPPHARIQSTEVVWSTNPNTSTRDSMPALRAHLQMSDTARFSPSDTRAEATSMRSTLSSCRSRRAMSSFSWGMNDTPLVCSPSRSVVSMISIFRRSGLPMLQFSGGFQAESRCRRGRSSGNISCSRSARSVRFFRWPRW